MRHVILVAVLALTTTSATAGPLPKGRWSPLFTQGAKWTLPSAETDKREGAPTGIELEITSVRRVGSASVATLAWTLVGPDDDSAMNEEDTDLLPSQIAITKRGVFAFDDRATDKSIAAALRKKPTFTEPARASVRKGKGRNAYASGFAFVPATNKDVACFGFDTTDPELDFGGAPTTSWMCFDATGLVGVYDGWSAYGRDVLPDEMRDYIL